MGGGQVLSSRRERDDSHVVISQPGDESEPPVRPWFGTFFDRRSKNAAETKKLVEYCRRCNFMLQQGKPHDGKTDERILNDGTIIRFTSDSLFELTFPDGHQELWNPEQPSVAQRRGDAEGAKELRDSAGDIHPPSTGGYEGKRDDPQPDVRRSPGRFYLYNHN